MNSSKNHRGLLMRTVALAEDERIGRAETRLRYYAEDNTFDLETRIINLKLKGLVAVEVLGVGVADG